MNSLPFGAEIMWVLIAMAGGVARYLDQYLKTGSPPKIGMLFAHAVVSGFSGYMMVQFVLRFSPDWSIIAAGAGGYLGTQGLDFISSSMKNRFGGGNHEPRRPHDRKDDDNAA